jgi:hypothetical protein
MKETIDFDTLIGDTAKLHLCVDQSPNCFQLGSVVFEVIEDENDGYRSMMDKVVIKQTDARSSENTVLATVVIKNAISNGDWITDFKGYELVDVNTGHSWLRFGTNNTEDYYPSFRFDWTPPTEEVKRPDSNSEISNLIKQ